MGNTFIFAILDLIMSARVVYALAIAAAIVASGTVIYLQTGIGSQNYPTPAFSELKTGANIHITTNDTKMMGGTVITSFQKNGYYGVGYNLQINENSAITGSWISTGKTLVWVFNVGEPYMETPLPSSTSGSLNETLLPGQYTLVIGGYPGDVVSITNSIEIRNFVPYQIGNFSIPAGTYVNTSTTYSFHLDKPGELVGSLASPAGIYAVSLYSSTGNGFTTACFNSSAKPGTMTFSLGPNSPIYGPGYYNLTLSSGFYVNQTLKFLYYFDNSTL